LRSKLPAFVLMFCLAMSLLVLFASPALAVEEGHEETEVPGSENGLVVAIGGAIGVFGLLAVIIFMILRKGKKKKADTKQ